MASSPSLQGTPLPSSASSVRSVSPDTRPSLRVARSFTRLESTDGTGDPLTDSLSRLKGEPPVPEQEDPASSEDEDGNPLCSTLLPEGFDELPPDLLTLADRFIDSLTKPVHPAPVNVTQLAELFQQFYGTTHQAIGKYVSQSYQALASKKPRSRTSTTQMLSKAEMAQKKRDRKLLEIRRIALEEAIEKRVTEGMYEKIWRHKSTEDEARDDSLHSKIAALKVVGVNLGHLGVELESEEKAKLVDHELQEAIKSLIAMNGRKYPLGKLLLLKQAHKAIVDCLTNHISTTDADSLLPTLIYTLILSPPEPRINAVSNLHFTQRFRAANFIDGEAAYCLTNFEAAISFLETVDLATLNISITESIDGASSPASSLDSLHQTLKPHALATTTTATNITALPARASPTAVRARGISYLTPIDIATTAANTAVSTADQGIRGIGVALESSYKFLFDRTQIAPKTLEDARKLVEAPSNPAITALQREDSDMGSIEEGPKSFRESSPAPSPTPSPSPGRAVAAAAAVSLEPLKHIGHIGSSIGRFANIGMRGLARVAPTLPPHPQAQALEKEEVKDLLETFPDLANSRGLSQLGTGMTGGGVSKLDYKVDERLAGCTDAAELRIKDVEGLLKEYKALVEELKRRRLVD